TNVNSHIALGTALLRQKKWDDAIAQYRTAIELDPKNALAHSNLGEALAGQGKLDEAVAEHRKAIELDPNYALAHYRLGVALFNQCELSDGTTRKHIDAIPNRAAKLPKLAEAAACFKKVIDLDPNLFESYVGLGSVLRYQGQFDEAI